MIRRSSLVAILSSLAFIACSTDKVAQAGGDDMGNFVRAELLDSTGTPLVGRIHAFSDVDTFSMELDKGGVLTLPARHRSWLALRTQAGSGYLLHAPLDSGTLQTMRLGTPRPLVGWLRRKASLRIAGLGATAISGGLFRFAEVPPGFMLLEAWSDSFSASVPLNTSGGNTSQGRIDSFVVAPLSVSGPRLVTAARDDTAACGAACQWIWTSANVLAGPGAIIDTFRLAGFSSSTVPDTGGILSVDSVHDLGNWLLLWIRMRQPGASPVFLRVIGDTVPGNMPPHVLTLGAAPIVDTLVLPGADTTRLRLVALPRPDGTVFADSIVIQYGRTLAIAPSNRVALHDTCDATNTSQARSCGRSPVWFLRP